MTIACVLIFGCPEPCTCTCTGDEYGFVVLSTVRSQPIEEIANPDHVQPDRLWLRENLGFVTDEHQTNVAITRSKYGLIIVGKYSHLHVV